LLINILSSNEIIEHLVRGLETKYRFPTLVISGKDQNSSYHFFRGLRHSNYHIKMKKLNFFNILNFSIFWCRKWVPKILFSSKKCKTHRNSSVYINFCTNLPNMSTAFRFIFAKTHTKLTSLWIFPTFFQNFDCCVPVQNSFE
jgi:hypothetical protein